MAVEVVMPQMGQSVAEGTVVQWLVKEGDRVEQDQPILAISTDKVDVEIPSPASGVLKDIRVREGETVEVMTVLAIIEEDGAPANAPAGPASGYPAAETPAGAEAPAAAGPEAAAHRPSPGAPVRPARSTPDGEAERRYSPAVRRLAEEHGIDLDEVPGTGAGGRVTRQDVEAYLEARAAERAGRPPAAPPAPARPVAAPAEAPARPVAPAVEGKPGRDAFGPIEVIPFSAVRKRIAEHMVASVHTSPHVTSIIEVDVTNLVRFRAEHKDAWERREGFPLTYTPFFVQAAVAALRDFPQVNASVGDNALVVKEYINIGVAVAAPDGLIVPVIKHADEKSFTRLAREVHDLATRAREKKLTPDDVQGGTFTITNPGIFGTIMGTPIINQPQVAIMDVEAITKRPVVVEGPDGDAIAIRSMVYVGLSYDHRVIDGAVGAQFLARVKRWLETTPFQL